MKLENPNVKNVTDYAVLVQTLKPVTPVPPLLLKESYKTLVVVPPNSMIMESILNVNLAN